MFRSCGPAFKGPRLPQMAGGILLSELSNEFGEGAGLGVAAEIFDLLFRGLVLDFLVYFGLDLPLEGQAVEGFFSCLTHATLPPWA